MSASGGPSASIDFETGVPAAAAGDNDNKNFVVQSMTTNNQRASSKSSTGSAHSFIQKLTTTQKAGVAIANPQTALHGSA